MKQQSWPSQKQGELLDKGMLQPCVSVVIKPQTCKRQGFVYDKATKERFYGAYAGGRRGSSGCVSASMQCKLPPYTGKVTLHKF